MILNWNKYQREIKNLKRNESNEKVNQKNQNNIIPNHCVNLVFVGAIKNNKQNSGANFNIFKNIETNSINNENLCEINDDYVSPTFNLHLNYNSLDKDKEKNNLNTIESSNKNDKDSLFENIIINFHFIISIFCNIFYI